MTTTCLIALWLLTSTIPAADAAVPAGAQAPPNKVSPGGQPKSIPLTLIIDDPAPCINVYWWHVEERQKTGKPTAESGEPIVRDVPVAFAAELAEVLRRRGIKGKFTVLPYPAGLGSIAQGLNGYSQADVERWLTIVRREIAPAWTSRPKSSRTPRPSILRRTSCFRRTSGSGLHIRRPKR